jgi:hypothetical protein
MYIYICIYISTYTPTISTHNLTGYRATEKQSIGSALHCLRFGGYRGTSLIRNSALHSFGFGGDRCASLIRNSAEQSGGWGLSTCRVSRGLGIRDQGVGPDLGDGFRV